MRLKRALPFVFLALGLVMVVSMGIGVADALTDGDLTAQDAARLSIMTLATLTLAGPAAVLAATVPGGRAFGALFSIVLHAPSRFVPSRRARSATPAATRALLLGQVSSRELHRLAPAGLGRPRPAARSARAGARYAQALAWIALVVALIGVLIAAAAALGAGAVQSLVDGDSIGPAIVIRLALAAASGVGAVFLALAGVAALSDRRRRRMKKLLQRALRYLLRLFDGGVRATQMAAATLVGGFRTIARASVPGGSGAGRSLGLASAGLGPVARLAAAAFVVGGLGVVPLVAGESAFGIGMPGRDRGGRGDSSVLSASATPVPASASPTPTPAPQTASPSPSPSSPATTTATATPFTQAPTLAPNSPPPPPPTSLPPDVPGLADFCVYDRGVPPASGSAVEYADYAAQWSQATNNYRNGLGLSALEVDSRLVAAAREHAEFVLLRRWWEAYGGDHRIHCDDRSRDQLNRAFDAGYPFVVVGENVSWGDVGLPIEQTFNNTCGQRDATGHCTLNEDPALSQFDGSPFEFRKTGVACYSRPDLQLFACAQVLAE